MGPVQRVLAFYVDGLSRALIHTQRAWRWVPHPAWNAAFALPEVLRGKGLLGSLFPDRRS